MKGYVHEVMIACGSEVIARHPRSYEHEAVIFDPLHYLALLEQKTRALDQAAPLAGWQLPECFATLRRLLEARLRKHGSREYVQVLRLMETFSLAEVTRAIEDALQLGTISFDAVKHLLLCRIEQRPPRLDMENYPYLPSGAGTHDASFRLHGAAGGGDSMSSIDPSTSHPETTDTPQVLLEHHLSALRLPTILREYDKVAQQCAAEASTTRDSCCASQNWSCWTASVGPSNVASGKRSFPVVKSLDSFEFLAIPSLNKAMVLELARCEFIGRRENVLLLGNSGTGKTHIALALGLAACQHGHRVRFTTAAALVNELIEARDEKKLLRFQKQIASYELLIVDELGFVPLSKTGAELLFEMLSQRYERGSTLVTSNLPFAEWTEVLGSERLTGALLDRLTHHVHILEMNGDSFRLKQSRRKRSHRQLLTAQPCRPTRRTRCGENAVFRYAPDAILPANSFNFLPHWPAFTPPHWLHFYSALDIKLQ